MAETGNFFELFQTQPAGNTAAAEPQAFVTLTVPGGETLKVPAAAARGATVAQLFQRYAPELGIRTQRINRFVQAGRIVPGETLVAVGEAYQGTATLDEKGF